ncbi:substrate-binding domain-containing protein [Georgenia sp. SUBG003]|uniref:substrate-binding domain-containing protein n=1 Tax=Georgenia sp. SUBG003 TaxID=1497974 RepID=UPI003AB676BA
MLGVHRVLLAHVMRAITALLALDEPPTAILSTNSRLSLGVVPALHQFGRTDIALVSYGDFAMAETLSPAVTVIDHSPEAIGDMAAKALLARLQPGDKALSDAPVIPVPAQLVARGSGELTP